MSVGPETWDNLSFKIETIEDQTVLQVEGEIDLASVPHFEQWLKRAQALDLPVTVDLRKVTYMDSIGINALDANNTATVKITLLILPGVLGKLLRVADLDQRFHVREG